MNYKSKYTGKQIDDGIRPYKVYVALLTQSGTSAPVAIVLENTLGGDIVWTRSAAGMYAGTLTGAFPTGKVYAVISPDESVLMTPILPIEISLTRTNDNQLNILLNSWEGDGEWDYSSTRHSINAGMPMKVEIRVYP